MFHVLVAEDEVWIRNGIVEMIERFGLDFKVVAQASDGAEAWNLINEVWPNVVITDIVMPELDGLSLLGKCDEYKLGIVPIVISGYENFAYARQAIRYGATEYLLKPVVAEDLKQALLRSLERLQGSVHLYEPLHQIQEFLGVMEVWDHQRLVSEAGRILGSIYKVKTPNPGIRNGLFRIFSDKLNEQLRSVDPHHQNRELGETADKPAVQAHFAHLLEQWSRRLNAPLPAGKLSGQAGERIRSAKLRQGDHAGANRRVHRSKCFPVLRAVQAALRRFFYQLFKQIQNRKSQAAAAGTGSESLRGGRYGRVLLLAVF